MKTKKIITLILALVMVFSLGACGLSGQPTDESTKTPTEPVQAATTTPDANEPAAPAEDARVIRFASTDTTANWQNPGYSNAASDVYMRDLIAERFEGRYVLEVYTDGQLAASDTEAVAGLRNGDFEISSLSNGSFSTFSDAFAELNVPFFYPSTDVARQVLDGDIGDAMIAKAEADTGLHVMFIKDHGFRQVTTSGKEVVAPADFKSLKMRTQADPVQMAAFEALGASITSIPFAELYTSLQQKVVDAQENPWSTIYSKQYYEVQSYACETNHILTCVIYVMSQEFWDSIPAEDQAIFEEIFAEVEAYHRDVVTKGDVYYKEACAEAGMKIYEPTADELAAIKDVMVEAVYGQCEEAMGSERWEKLNTFVNSIT